MPGCSTHIYGDNPFPWVRKRINGAKSLVVVQRVWIAKASIVNSGATNRQLVEGLERLRGRNAEVGAKLALWIASIPKLALETRLSDLPLQAYLQARSASVCIYHRS